MWMQEVPMREKESRKCQAVPREEEECGGAAWTDEREDDGVGGKKQAIGGRERNIERAFKPAEMQPWI